MNYYITMYLATLMECIVFYLLSLGLIEKRKQFFSKRLWVMFTVPIIIALYTPLISKHFLYSLVTIIPEICILTFCLKIKLKDFLEIFVIIYIFVVIFIQVPITIILSVFNITNEVSVYLIGSLLTLVSAFVIYLFVPLNRLYLVINKQNKITRFIISNICLIAIFITVYFKAETIAFYDNILVILVTVLLLIFINVEIIVTRTHLISQHKQLEAYNSYLPIIEQLITEVRHRQHNHDNDIQTIQMMPTAHQTYDELSNAIKGYCKHMIESNVPSNLLKLNTKLIAGFIFAKCNQALETRKTLSVQLNNFQLISRMPEYELITVMGILIDNALDATPEEQTATIIIDSIDNKIIFKTYNIGPVATPPFISQIFSEGYTTKHKTDHAPHGLGLPTLIKMIKKYDGEITIDNETIDHKIHISFEMIV